MKTLKEILEALNDQEDISKKIQQVSLNSDILKRQLLELNNMWKKKTINDAEYKKRMEDLNKQLMAQKQQSDRVKTTQLAANKGINQNQVVQNTIV
jgi:hypothetical protein